MDEREYYRRRAEVERTCARDAASPNIAAIHSELAMRYNLVAETGHAAGQRAEEAKFRRQPDTAADEGNSRRSRRSARA